MIGAGDTRNSAQRYLLRRVARCRLRLVEKKAVALEYEILAVPQPLHGPIFLDVDPTMSNDAACVGFDGTIGFARPILIHTRSRLWWTWRGSRLNKSVGREVMDGGGKGHLSTRFSFWPLRTYGCDSVAVLG